MRTKKKPVTAPAKLGSTLTTSGSHWGSSSGPAADPHGRRRGALPPTQEESILLAGKRFGLLHDGPGRRHHKHGSRWPPQQPATDEDERLTIHERKRLYFQKLRKAQQAVERQQLHQQLSASAFLTDQVGAAPRSCIPRSADRAGGVKLTLPPLAAL